MVMWENHHNQTLLGGLLICYPRLIVVNTVSLWFYVGKTLINHTIWEWIIPPIKMVIWGMVYDCFNHIIC